MSYFRQNVSIRIGEQRNTVGKNEDGEVVKYEIVLVERTPREYMYHKIQDGDMVKTRTGKTNLKKEVNSIN